MARTTAITKRTLITKANRNMVVATGLAAFVLVFALVAGRAMVNQIAYQQRVISAKKEALATLRADLEAVDSLQLSYQQFVAENPNALGGAIDGEGEQDGDNARIVLDALPSRYDFPALTTSVEELVVGQGLQILGISGTDEEATQGEEGSSPNPAPVAMPFQVQASGSYGSVQDLISAFRRSIRPFQIETLEIAGSESSMTVTINAQTFYQPEKNLTITEEVVE
jgi:hypothetical protein